LSPNIRSPFTVKEGSFLFPFVQPTLPPVLSRFAWKPSPFFTFLLHRLPFPPHSSAFHWTGQPEYSPHTLCSVPPQPLQMMCRTPANCMHLNCRCSTSHNFHAIHPSCLRPFHYFVQVPEN